MSPAPRNNPKAFDIVGAAVTAVAAKAESNPLRVTPFVCEVVICNVSRSSPRAGFSAVENTPIPWCGFVMAQKVNGINRLSAVLGIVFKNRQKIANPYFSPVCDIDVDRTLQRGDISAN